MRVIRHISGYKDKQDVVLTIGNFDGLHLGHQKLIKEVVSFAKSVDILAAVFSFEPHPSRYFKRLEKNYRIISLKNKLQILRRLGINLVILQKFNQQIAIMKPEEFIIFILEKFRVKHLVIGHDFTFGYNKEGNISILNNLANKYDFTLTVVAAEKEGQIIHSSSYIRKLLAAGDVDLLTMHLGYPYYITGVVIEGRKLARELGYPTANIKLHNLSRPKYGVYLVKVSFDQEEHFGMANIGVRPTIDGVNELLEINIFDYEADIYGKKLKVELLQFIRAEKKFANVSELTIQIAQDKIKIKELLSVY